MADEAQHKYEWDVAISVLDKDLSFAQAIYNGLKDRFRVFLYSEDQKELQFKDGLEVFSDVFRQSARVVVVLWREQWGTTKWTGAEFRAIKSRVFEDGPEFLALVKMESGLTPTWVPPTYIYRQQQGWEITTLVENVAGQINRLGGNIQTLTALDIAKQQREEREWAAKHNELLMSADAQQAISRELEALAALFKEQINALNPEVAGRKFEFEEGYNGLAVLKFPCSVVIRTATTTQDLPYIYRLYQTYYDGAVSVASSRVNSSPPVKTASFEYGIDCDAKANWFWTDLKTKHMVTSAALVEDTLTRLLNRTHAIETGKTERKRRIRSDPFADDDFNPLTHRF